MSQCIYTNTIPCSVKTCAILKCHVLQKHLNMSLEEVYALGLRDRPKSIYNPSEEVDNQT